MKKIAVVFPKNSLSLFNKNSTDSFGGAQVQMFLIANELTGENEIDCLSLVPDLDINQTNLKAVKLYNNNDNILKKIVSFHRNLVNYKPDILIQHGLTIFSCLLSLYCKLMGIKFVYMFAHDLEAEGKYQTSGKKAPLFKLLLLKSTLLITQNDYQKDLLMSKYKRNSYKIYNGFNIPEYINKKPRQVLWVARADKWKHPEKYIEIAKNNSTIKFTMVCPKLNDEDFYSSILDSASKVPNLTFKKFVPFQEVNAEFKNSSIFVNTSDYEGYPQTFIQALMFGLPILSLNVDPDKLLTEKGCGFVFNGNIELLSNKLNELFKDKNLYASISKKAYDYAATNHNITKNVDTLLKLLNNNND